MKSAPRISVVVPVHNGVGQLEQCLAALAASAYRAHEIVVVDDGSTDGSAEAARTSAHGVEVLRLSSRSGPAAARNRGAQHASGDVLLFVDADVVVDADTLARVAGHFSDRGDVAAVFGSYDDEPAAANFASQYKNLFHHYVHQRSSSEAETFWAGCGAVRRRAFHEVGGFDEKRYSRPSVEDIELGQRLRRAGFRVVLDRALQVKHLKRWTLPTLVRTDIFQRALPWTRLILEGGRTPNDLNLRTADRISAVLAAIAVVALAFSYTWPLLLFAALIAAGAVLTINLHLYLFFKARRGAWFAVRAFPVQFAYYLYSGAVFALCYVAHVLGRGSEGPRAGRIRRQPVARRVNDA